MSQDGSLAVIEVPLTGAATDGQSEAAVATVTRLRETYVPDAFDDSGAQEVLVGGDTAFVKDFFDISDSYTPLIVLVLGLSFVLLTIVFRSLVVPAKAIVMNLLSVGAAYGLIVLVFQKGGPTIRRVDREPVRVRAGRCDRGVAAAVPVLDPVRLSMDYHVFLLTRIREEYDKTGDNAEAVAYGLRTTGASSPARRSSWSRCSPGSPPVG